MQGQNVFLSIRDGGKGVAYGGADEDRPDGSRNYGFKPLKSNPLEIASIPEVQVIPALKNALVVLNAENSPFFTIGCEKASGKNDSVYWMNGYLEFAFNYKEWVADAGSYFKLFSFLTSGTGASGRKSGSSTISSFTELRFWPLMRAGSQSLRGSLPALTLPRNWRRWHGKAHSTC